MIIYLTPEQAEHLRLDIYPEVVRACFYLGFNYSFTVKLVSDPTRVAERDSIVEMARSLGMSGDYVLAVRTPGDKPFIIDTRSKPDDHH
jgi:hypothetical protein